MLGNITFEFGKNGSDIKYATNNFMDALYKYLVFSCIDADDNDCYFIGIDRSSNLKYVYDIIFSFDIVRQDNKRNIVVYNGPFAQSCVNHLKKSSDLANRRLGTFMTIINPESTIDSMTIEVFMNKYNIIPQQNQLFILTMYDMFKNINIRCNNLPEKPEPELENTDKYQKNNKSTKYDYEDMIKKICEMNGIKINGKKLEEMINIYKSDCQNYYRFCQIREKDKGFNIPVFFAAKFFILGFIEEGNSDFMSVEDLTKSLCAYVLCDTILNLTKSGKEELINMTLDIIQCPELLELSAKLFELLENENLCSNKEIHEVIFKDIEKHFSNDESIRYINK